jgi:hypothetical protein
MSNFLRIGTFAALCLISILTPFPFFLFCSFLYVIFWSGVEIFIITIGIDSVFGTTTTSFLYTLSFGGVLLASTVLRPYLSWYATKT